MLKMMWQHQTSYKVLHIITKGTKNKEIDIQLFSFVAKCIEDSHCVIRN